MRLEKCYFCSSTIYPGHGITFVRNDCKVFRFCRSKCRKNFNMKRNPRKMGWTKAFRKARGKEMKLDTTFEFERKRNVPQKYDRELTLKTIKAMQKVASIKEAREERFYKERMKVKKIQEKAEIRRDIKQNLNLVKEPELQEKVQLHRVAEEKIAQADKMAE